MNHLDMILENGIDMEILQTDVFKMKRFDFAMEMVSVYGKPWIIAESMLLILSITAAIFIDLRWAVVFLMSLFIIAPAMFAFLYYYHGLKPECVVNIIDHNISFNDNHIEVTLFRKSESTDPQDEGILQPSSAISINYTSCSSYNIGSDSVTIPLHGDSDGFLWIPLSAFTGPTVFNKAIERVIKGIRKVSESRTTVRHATN